LLFIVKIVKKTYIQGIGKRQISQPYDMRYEYALRNPMSV